MESKGQYQTSSFSQSKVMDMQCDLLISDFKNPTTIALMQENIGHISDGSSPHRVSALKIGFKKAFELKKRNSGVLLRCPNTSCKWYSNPVSHTTLGTSIYCPRFCGGYVINDNFSHYCMQCVGCGCWRTNYTYISCKSCGKKFL